MAKRMLYFVRHGQYTNTASPDDEPDGHLTDLGRDQSALTGDRLRGLPITAIHHSTLIRATETARIIGARFPAVRRRADPLLCECVPCVPPGQEELFRGLPQEFIDNGAAQATKAYDEYVAPTDGDDDSHEIVVSSGNLISYLICRAMGAPAERWFSTDIQNCAISEVWCGPPRGVTLVRHNDLGHLPDGMQTWM